MKTSLARQKDTANLQVGKQKRATEQRMTQTETNIQDKKQDISDTQSAIKVAQNNLQSYEKRYQLTLIIECTCKLADGATCRVRFML